MWLTGFKLFYAPVKTHFNNTFNNTFNNGSPALNSFMLPSVLLDPCAGRGNGEEEREGSAPQDEEGRRGGGGGGGVVCSFACSDIVRVRL